MGHNKTVENGSRQFKMNPFKISLTATWYQRSIASINTSTTKLERKEIH